jgi:hypothetical protein
MAFDLVARLRIIDNATAPLRRMQRATEQLQRTTERVKRSTELWNNATGRLNGSMERFSAETKKANFNLKQFGNGLRNVAEMGSGIRGLAGHFTALAAAIGGAYTAHKIFEKTIAAAARYEQSEVMIKAAFKNDQKAKQFMEEMQKLAINSPLLNSQDMFANAKSFISYTQDIDLLKRMYKLTERLLALDPMQGVEGAVYALREIFSGSYKSIKDRFEFGTSKEWKQIASLPVEKQVPALEKLLDKYRITEDMIKKMGSTTSGLFNQIRESLDVAFMKMGQPANQLIGRFLDKVNNALTAEKLHPFIKFGQDMLLGITKGFISMTSTLGRVIDSIINNPRFQRLKDVKAKVSFVIENLFSRFNSWLANGGREQIVKMVSTVTSIIAEGLTAATPYLIKISAQIGYAIGKGIVDSARDYVKNHPITALITPQTSDDKNYVTGKFRNWLIQKGLQHFFGKPKTNGSHFHGLSYVPYNGYVATLHKGERILTAKENREYSKGGRSVHVSFGDIHLYGVGGDMKKAARELMHYIADELERAGANGAGMHPIR